MAGLRFTPVVAAYLLSTPHSSGFARLALHQHGTGLALYTMRARPCPAHGGRAFYFTIPNLTFNEIVFFES
jgi:hypothetical protein